MFKTNKKFSFITGLILSGLMSSNAMAGFQFKGAPVPAQASTNNGNLLPMMDAPAPSMPAAPTQPVSIIWEKPSIQFTGEPDLPQIPKAPEAITLNNIPQKTENFQPIKNEIIASPVNNNAYDLAVGFGKDLPLSIAIQQIVPNGFSYNLDPTVDGNKLVSWEGGQEWPTVLKNMADNAGYSMKLDGHVATISSFQTIRQSAPVPMNINTPKQPETVIEPAPKAAPANVIKPKQEILPEAKISDDLIPTAPAELMQETFVEQIPLPVETAEIPQPQIAKIESAIEPEKKEEIKPQWVGQKGMSLRTVLESWADLENVDLFWSSEFDYILAGDVSIEGDFQKATETILAGFSEANPRPSGRLHPNLPDGPAVLVIETQQLIR